MAHRHYSASLSFLPGPNHATLSDVFTLECGPREVYVSRVHLAAQQTGGGVALFRMIRRSIPNVGGTRQAVALSPWDTNYPASSCGVYAYTAHPTAVGTQLGVFRTTPFQFDNGGVHMGIISWEFGSEESDVEVSHPFVIRPGEILALNVAGLSDTGTVETTVEFYENW